ncbi:MBL fold metallo-hydrolase [Desulfitobacterium sp. Sab5]|uniref:MBL fold metallo-hydrolase n=1 Tax=Desulfitobacterium nosdiversum TaxID=3375356 RepID=UPI003CEAE74F
MKIKTITTARHDTDNLILRDVPVNSTIVDIPDFGLTIIDTGSPDNSDLKEELEDLGYTPDDFRLVINTHLHVDHIGGNPLFRNARILISRKELDFEVDLARLLKESLDPLAALHSLGRYKEENSSELAQQLINLVNEYPAAAWIGDWNHIGFFEDEPKLPEGMSFLQAPGHSVDSRAVLLKGKTRIAIAAGDALYHRDLWKKDLMSALHYNARQFQHNAEKIAHFPYVIIPGHDHAFDNLTGEYLFDSEIVI